MINCLVIDDDPLICDLIKHFCSKQEAISSCISVSNGNQAVQAMSAQSFNLIFLDFNLPDINGRNLLQYIPTDVSVIMITSEVQFAIESYEYHQIIDFLVKPLNFERFNRSVFKFIQLNGSATGKEGNRQKTLIVKEGNNTVILKIDEIKHIKSESNYVIFYLKDKKVMSLMSLKKLTNLLPPNFLQTHRSFLVNMNYVDSIQSESLKLDSVEIPIGGAYKQVVLDYISNLS